MLGSRRFLRQKRRQSSLLNKSTPFTTQLPLDHWSEVIGDPVIAEGIRDRL